MVLQDSKFVPLIQVTLELSVKKRQQQRATNERSEDQRPARLFIQVN